MPTQSDVHIIHLVTQPPNACELHMNKIVVVIPTLLTREALLLRTIDSVLAQTRRADHMVISCDADGKEIRAFAARCNARFAGESIEIVANHGHKGISGNINNAVSKLIGFDGSNTIVSLLDDDDYWAPDYLSSVEKKVLEGATFVASAFAYINERRDAPRPPPQEIEPDLFLVGNPGISNSTMSIRLDVLRQIGGWNTRLASCTDRDACLRLLEVEAKYGAANEAIAYIDRSHGNARLTDKGSWAKFSGLKEFYRAWRPMMAPQVYADSRARALKLFGYDPGMPALRPPPEGADLPHLVVAVIALDEALLNRLLLSFENSAAQKFQITFIVFRNNPSLAWNSHAGKLSEVLFFQHPNADQILKIAEARNFLQMKVRDYVQRHGKEAIIWFLDEDFCVDSTVLAKLAEIPSLDLGRADAILGKYEGDSPNAAFSGLLFELSDLYENLRWLQARPSDSLLPDRAVQNDALQAAHPETYNYALSHNAKPTPNETAWLEPAFQGESVAAAKARLVSSLGAIQQGASLFRPLRA
ncbi:MAG TPA: glycosyltransferase, partial [Rhodobacteraceae bacterium]|nr:glycosyltransferase [Paracoccaceae bacterium]